jgi:uncharacterized protein yuaY
MAIDDGERIESLRRRNDAEREVYIASVQRWVHGTYLSLKSATSHDDYLAECLTQPFKCCLGRSSDLEMVDAQDALKNLLALLIRFDNSLTTEHNFSNYSQSAPSCIFIVHGRDLPLLMQVELFCRKITDLEVIVLKDQASKGATILEKLERHLNSETSYVIVLLTGDDAGRLFDESTEKPRARQNVILELGYAMGRLGRDRVAVLSEPRIEVPSDIAGMVLIHIDPSGSWKLELFNELKSAGIEVSM